MAASIKIPNKWKFERTFYVRHYSRLTALSKPEARVLELLENKLQHMKMLDIGVGGGRTTLHFAHKVKEYVGIDLAHNMVDACKKRFSGINGSITFKVCDVRNMHIFGENYFDFILFSFNGIDLMSHEDRIKALNQIRLVGRKNSYFCFSTHNIQATENVFTPKYRHDNMNTTQQIKQILKFFLKRILNKSPNNLKAREYAMINDAVHYALFKKMYIKPQFQISQLRENNFKNIKVFSLNNGNEILYNLDNVTDWWLYYLCKISK